MGVVAGLLVAGACGRSAAERREARRAEEEAVADPPPGSRRARNEVLGRTPALRRANRSELQEIVRHVVADPETWTPPTARAPAAASEVDPELLALEALGYVDDVVEAGGRASHVTRHRPDGTAGGLTLYTPAGAPIAVLIDMEGREVWRWTFPIADAWPDAKLPPGIAQGEAWRRAVLLPGGDLVALWSGYGVVRIDRYSRLEWAHFLPVHHDLDVRPDGRVVTLTRALHPVPRLTGGKEVLEDYLVTLSPEGAVESELSLIEAFEAHPGFKDLWASRTRVGDDPFHTNSVAVLDDRLAHLGPAFAPGNVLTSMRHLNAIAVVDPRQEAVVWVHQGDYRAQHDPRVVAPGRVLVFDNRGLGKASRLLELDVATGAVAWSYQGTAQDPFFTVDCGHAQRLVDGNTLINESVEGRAFEVRPDGEIVWEYRTPHRLEDGRKVARFYELRRMPPDFDRGWMVGEPRR